MKQSNGRTETENSILRYINNNFPNCTQEYISNLDDVHSAIRFCPDSKTIITIKIPQGKEYFLCIQKFSYSEYVDVNNLKLIFFGSIPSDKDLCPDFDFIEKILINYKLF